MTALEKVLSLAGPTVTMTGGAPAEKDLNADLVLALSTALDEVRLYLASSDDDGDDGSTAKSGGKSGDGDGEDGEFAAMVARLVKKGVPEARAKMMARQAMKRVKASALAESACVILAGLTEPEPPAGPQSHLGRLVALAAPPGESASDRRSLAAKGWALKDGSFPIPDKKHLHSAAVLAASGHGNVSAAKALIRKRARELGVDVTTLPGFGGDSEKSEKVAATMLALAAKAAGDGGVPMHHPPFTGMHTHSHHLTTAHSHEHQHFNDNSHDGGPAHRSGSRPGTPGLW
jgi:hypothetical protein